MEKEIKTNGKNGLTHFIFVVFLVKNFFKSTYVMFISILSLSNTSQKSISAIYCTSMLDCNSFKVPIISQHLFYKYQLLYFCFLLSVYNPETYTNEIFSIVVCTCLLVLQVISSIFIVSLTFFSSFFLSFVCCVKFNSQRTCYIK